MSPVLVQSGCQHGLWFRRWVVLPAVLYPVKAASVRGVGPGLPTMPRG